LTSQHTVWFSFLCFIFSINQLSGQKFEDRVFYDLGLNFNPIGYYAESGYRINKDYNISIRYESNNYCLICGDNSLVSNIWGMRQFVVSGFYKRNMDDFGISIGAQYIIGFPWYGDRYVGHEIEAPVHRFGLTLGVDFHRISIKLSRRIPKTQNNKELQISIGILFGNYRREIN
jgi:hypothetical protein